MLVDGCDIELEDSEISVDELSELARKVVAVGTERGLTCGTAESCTGGLICAHITSVSGSSAVLLGGVVSYSPLVKASVLGVDQEVIEGPGVVSRGCAEEMAEGARDALGCDVAVSVTGIAGPGGAEPNKPVGTVWLGLSYGQKTRSELHLFGGDRETVRMRAVRRALELICEGFEDA